MLEKRQIIKIVQNIGEKNMPEELRKKREYSQAQNKATQRYIKNNYDSVMIRMPKGKKEKIKAFAESKNESLNGFVNRAIDEAMESNA